MSASASTVWATEGWAAERCKSKVRFSTKGSCILAAYKRSLVVGYALYTYKCPNCGKFHMTRAPQQRSTAETVAG